MKESAMNTINDDNPILESLPWPEWQLLEPMDSGSFGTVYRACRADNPVDQCAVKIIPVPQDDGQIQELRSQGMSDTKIRSIFEKEAAALLEKARKLSGFMDDPHIVSVFDVQMLPTQDEPGFCLYIRMELLHPLNAYFSSKSYDEKETVQIGIDLCEALEACHQAGIIHSDIKPDNLFVSISREEAPVFKLGDFSAAIDLPVSPESQAIRGTPLYMAPETALRQQCTVQSDLYMVGLTLYKLANRNRLPFVPEKQFPTHEDYAVAVQMRQSGIALPAPCDASTDFSKVVAKACAFRPEERYQTATEMKAGLNQLLKQHTRSSFSFSRTFWAVFAACLLVLVLAVVFLCSGNKSSGPAPVEADASVTEENSSAETLPMKLGELNDLLEVCGMFPSEKWNYRFPLSLEKLPMVRQIPALLPSITVHESSDILFLSPVSSEWIVWLEYPDGQTISMIWDQELDGYRMVSSGKGILFSSTIHIEKEISLDTDYHIMVFYDPERLSVKGFSAGFVRGQDEPVGIRTELEANENTTFIQLKGADRSPATAEYDSSGRLSNVYYAGKTYEIPSSSLPIIGVDLFQ